jgi:beta-arrestin
MFPCYRVFKKTAPNNKLTLYLSSRDLVISGNKIDKLQGVILVDPDYLQDKKVRFMLHTEQYRYMGILINVKCHHTTTKKHET